MKIRFAVAPGTGVLDRDASLDFADAVERSGFDGVWLSDLPAGPAIDPLLGLALIAGRTSRVKLGANVVPLGRNPFLLAKELAALDRISGGRLLLSFVTGLDQPGEREVLGIDGASRGEALEQTLALVRSWWRGDQLAALAEAARPLQDPLEVWLGGRGARALERVGRIADGWLGAMLTPQEARVARARIQESAARAGRELDPEHFGLSIGYARAQPPLELLESLSARRGDVDPLALLPAGAAALRSLLERHIDAGLSKFVLRPAVAAGSWQEELEWLGSAVLDLQS